jgi:hypothetical protein
VRDLAQKYRWFDTAHDLSWTVSIVEGRHADDVVRAYGGDPMRPVGHRTYRDATVPVQEFGRYFHVQVRTEGRHVVAIENNGWTGKFPEIARRVSRGSARFFSVYWNVNGPCSVVQAIGGQVSAFFDPLYVETGEGPQAGEIYPDWLERVTIDPAHVRSTALALADAQTGLMIRHEWLETAMPTYRIPDPHVMLRHVENAERA